MHKKVLCECALTTVEEHTTWGRDGKKKQFRNMNTLILQCASGVEVMLQLRMQI